MNATDRCYTQDELTAVLLGEPTTMTLRQMEQHSLGCRDCAVDLEEAKAINRSIESEPAVDEEAARTRLRASIEELVTYIGELRVPWGRSTRP